MKGDLLHPREEGNFIKFELGNINSNSAIMICGDER